MKMKIGLLSLIVLFSLLIVGSTVEAASCAWEKKLVSSASLYVNSQTSNSSTANLGSCSTGKAVADDSNCSAASKPEKDGQYEVFCCCDQKPIVIESKTTLFQAPDLQIEIPGMEKLSDITCVTGEDCSIPWMGQYIKGIYNYAIAIAGILAAVVMMAGGLLWLLSRGDSSKITKAKDLIIGSVVGMIILSGSYLILTIINPNLVNLNNIEVASIKTIDLEPLSYEGNANNSQECLNCTTLNVPTKNGTLANTDLSNKLSTAWNASAKNWRVTEAYPWSSPHQSKCHYNGTCVDVGLTTPQKTCAEVAQLIITLKNAGLKVLNEYPDCNGKKTKYTTGGHLHVY